MLQCLPGLGQQSDLSRPTAHMMTRPGTHNRTAAPPRPPQDPDAGAFLRWEHRLGMLHAVAAGMAFLHSRNVVHGDLRTANLFVCKDGNVKIGDFGFAKRLVGNKVGACSLMRRACKQGLAAPCASMAVSCQMLSGQLLYN